jgi:Tol biopolymer transport system component
VNPEKRKDKFMPKMKWKSRPPLIFSRSLIAGLLLVFIALIFVSGCNQQPSEEYKRNHPSAKQVNVFWMYLSPDNKTLLFNYQTPYWSRIATYDMKTGKIEKFKNDDITFIEMAQYSHDGKKIVFSGRMKRYDDAENFYIMNADG